MENTYVRKEAGVLTQPGQVDSQDSKMASIILLKEKKLLKVKLGELPSWILMRDFTPSGIAGAFQRGQSLMGMCK